MRGRIGHCLGTVSIACLAALLAGGLPGAAHGEDPGSAGAECTPEPVEHLGPACQLENGDYEVHLEDGTTLVTHGPDPMPAAGQVGFDEEAPRRPVVCAENDRMHVLYGHPSSSTNRYDDVVGDFRAIVERMNALLNAEGIASGQTPTDYKVACNEEAEIAVDTFEGPSTSAGANGDFAAIVSAAKDAGYDEKGTNYLIFYDDSSQGVCGVGHRSGDSRASEDNENLKGPDYGVTYEPCWYGRTPMHENAHNMGAVQRTAPMSDGTGHCLEGEDVMCYPSQNVLRLCTERIRFDCNHDTYFDTNPEEGSWLATNWNLGSELNTYLAFDQPQPPVADLTVRCEGLECSLDASQSRDPDGEIRSYEWAIETGGSATGELVSHEFPEEGRYEIVLEVTDGDDLQDIDRTQVSVEADQPERSAQPRPTVEAAFTISCRGLNCTFNASDSQGPQADVDYRWSLGDETNTTGRLVQHGYDQPGVYEVELNVTGPEGRTDVEVKRLTLESVDAGENLTANDVAGTGDQPSTLEVSLGPLVGLASSVAAAGLLGRRP